MSDIYADALDEVYDRLVYQKAVDGRKLYGLMNAIYRGPQPEKKLAKDLYPLIIMLDGGFNEVPYAASGTEMNSDYKIILRLFYMITQEEKESLNTYDIDGYGILHLRSRVLDAIYRNTSNVKTCNINNSVRTFTVSAEPPVIADNKFYQDININLTTGMFALDGRQA